MKPSSSRPDASSPAADLEALASPTSHDVRPSAMPPAPQLSRRWLTISLIAVTLIPVALAATVWFGIPSRPEPKLPIDVFFEPVSWPPGGKEEVRLMPGIRIHNPTSERWQNISMAINSQYFFYCPEPLEAGGDFRVPLAFFKTSGNQAYRPNTQHINKLTIYAQLPSGRRAICELIQPQPLQPDA